jgi:hypothetical protein
MGNFNAIPSITIPINKKITTLKEAEEYLFPKPPLTRQTGEEPWPIPGSLPSCYEPDLYKQAIIIFNQYHPTKDQLPLINNSVININKTIQNTN